ncbi:NlpC/P60 family protein [Christiangramia fulva]|uniref:NlpC/P60 family protein n=1 Tax=Christiangramia fulva TaxID=2126553 RepID=A0A2R3Z248_9FLAO|nr:C40 family peptidase [Christiangramia fulva]AVR44315.1 NlpC/P60 family protein [Christiangramia fulva]
MKLRILLFPFLFLTAIILTSCGAKHAVITTKEESRYSTEPKRGDISTEIASKVVKNAQKFEGTRYRYGGTSKRGMDCSGLVYVSFLQEDISIPRTARAMSLQGERLFLKEVSPGDLLFFQTSKNRNVINHVGLVVKVKNGEIYFIHSTTSAGVIISLLSEAYWKNNFVMARRII